jgi:apolipoprotein N-acyltransferase
MRRLPVRAALAVLAGALGALALPPADLAPLAFLALAPLLLASLDARPPAALCLGLLSGIVWGLLVFRWMFVLHGFGFTQAVPLALLLGLFPALFAGLAPFLRRSRVPLLLSAPALWTSLDFLKAHAGFLALPWGSLAQTQHGNLPLLQAAKLGGEPAVTFAVALSGTAVAEAVARRTFRPLVVGGAVLAAAHAAGGFALGRPGATMLRLAAVQPAILPGTRGTPAENAASLDALLALTRRAAAGKPALVVWPETAVRGLTADPEGGARIAALADETGVPVLVGASLSEKIPGPGPGLRLAERAYNSAVLFSPGAPEAGPYNKRRLVPFAEFNPLPGFPWPKAFLPGTVGLQPGTRALLFDHPSGVRAAPLICWENLFAGLAREDALRGAGLLAVLTNDAWFGRTAAPRQHNAATVLRAVENGLPAVVASNTGPSEIVGPDGRIAARSEAFFSPDVVVGEVPVASGPTPYTRLGDLFAWLSSALAAAAVVSGVGRRA